MPAPVNRAPSLLKDPALEPVPVRAALIWGFGMKGCPPSTETAVFQSGRPISAPPPSVTRTFSHVTAVLSKRAFHWSTDNLAVLFY